MATKATAPKRTRKTPTQVKEALFHCLCEHGEFKSFQEPFRSGIADALAWVHGEPGTATGRALGELDGDSD